jgi:hypothetical protein
MNPRSQKRDLGHPVLCGSKHRFPGFQTRDLRAIDEDLTVGRQAMGHAASLPPYFLFAGRTVDAAMPVSYCGRGEPGRGGPSEAARRGW